MYSARSTTRLRSWFAVTLSLALGACGSNDLASGPESAPSPAASRGRIFSAGHGLLKCTPVPYTRVTQTVGIRGGRIRFGENTLEIPAGALLGNVTISAEALSDSLRSVRFEPHGLVFLGAAKLAMSYDGCDTRGLPARTIAYLDPIAQILELLDSKDYPGGQWVAGSVWHFSRYAVAW